MPNTWYIDEVNGADGNAGTSWGAALQTFNGLTAGKGYTAGDSVEVAKSPDPTSIGTGSWTSNIKPGGGMPAALAISGTANTTGSNLVKLTIPTYSSASVSTLTIGTGLQTLTIGTGLTFPTSNTQIYLINDSGHYMAGDVISYTSGTGVLNVNVSYIVGSGSFSSWTASLLMTGNVCQVLSVGGTIEANGVFTINTVDSTHITLNNTLYANSWTSGGTVQNITSKAVVLTTSGTKMISPASYTNGGLPWTAVNSSTVTPTVFSTTGKSSDGCVLINKTSPVNGTLYAYVQTGTLNLSAYQNVTFWIKMSTVTTTATQFKIALCSDTAGTTPVNNIPIPIINATGQWIPINYSTGGNLGASIKSIGIYSVTSTGGTLNFYLNDIIATTTNGLNLQSLISTNSNAQGGAEAWYGIQSIDPTGTIVLLDNITNANSNYGQGYFGTTQSVTTYKRETSKPAMQSSTTGTVNQLQATGTLGNSMNISGGWNTSSGLQDGETFLDGLNGNGYGLYIPSGISYNNISHINNVRYYYGIYDLASNNNTISIQSLSNNTFYGYYQATSNNNTVTITNANNNGQYGVEFNQGTGNTLNLTNANNNASSGNACYGFYALSNTGNTYNVANTNNNITAGIFPSGASQNTWGNITSMMCNGSYGADISSSNNNVFGNVTSASLNGSYGIYFTSSNLNIMGNVGNANANVGNGVYFSSAFGNILGTIGIAEFNTNYGLAFTSSYGNLVMGVTANYNLNSGVQFASNCNDNYIFNVSTTGNTTSGVSTGTGVNYIRNATIAESTPFSGATALSGMNLFVEKYNGVTGNNYIYNDKGIITTSTAQMYGNSTFSWALQPTSANCTVNYPLQLSIAKVVCVANQPITITVPFYINNAGITGALTVMGNQIAGVSTQTVTTNSGIVGSWQLLTLTFTPTDSGVLNVQALAYGGTTYTCYVSTINMTPVYTPLLNMNTSYQAQPFVNNSTSNGGFFIQ